MSAKKKNASNAAEQHPIITDSLVNLVTGMGAQRDSRSATYVSRKNAMQPSELDTRFTEHDLEHNIVAIPAEDMTRAWIDLQSNGDDGDAAAQIERVLNEVDARTAMFEGLLWSRLTGSAIALVGIGGQRMAPNKDGVLVPDLSQPRQPGKVLWLRVFDRFEVMSVDIAPDGSIGAYDVNIDGELTKVHASRVLRWDAEPMPRRMRTSAGWGLPVLHRCAPRIDDLDTAMAGIAVSMSRFSETVLSIDKFTAAMASNAGKDAMQSRISMLNLMRSQFGLMTLDGADKVSELSRSFAGVAENLDRLIERVASAARMPVALLMGRSPAGLNATGDADMRWWYGHIASQQEQKLRPPLWQLIRMIADGLKIDIEESVLDMSFCPLLPQSEKEMAETHLVQAQADVLYFDRGELRPGELRKARFGATGFSTRTVVEDPEIDGDPTQLDPNTIDPATLDPNGDPAPTPTSTATDVQKTALNGAQVTSMQGIVTSVAKGELPRDAGIAMLELAFQLSEAEATKVMGTAGSTFKPAEPTTATP